MLWTSSDLFHMFVDVVVNTCSNILICCQAVFKVLDPSLVTLCDDLQLANIVYQRLHFDTLHKKQKQLTWRYNAVGWVL